MYSVGPSKQCRGAVWPGSFCHMFMMLERKVKTVYGCLNFVFKFQIFMPPTLKKLMGHIAFGACMGGCVGHTFCTYCNF